MLKQKFMPNFTTEAELKAHQLKGLKWTAAHAYDGSPVYRAKLSAAGILPADIQSLEDIRKLPFTDARDLKDGYPFPLRSVPFEKIVRIHSSSGTTGRRKNLCYTQKDVDDWGHFFARAYEMAGVTPKTAYRLPSATASGPPAWGFSWPVNGWGPWPCRWGPAM